MVEQTKPIAESKNFIVLDKYTKAEQGADHYQSEAELERELIQDLRNQGYEFLPALASPEALLANVRERLEDLNSVAFSDAEWARFVATYLNSPSDGIIDKTRKVHDDYIHDFVFDEHLLRIGRVHRFVRPVHGLSHVFAGGLWWQRDLLFKELSEISKPK